MKLNIMVTYYNTKDLVSFGNYLLSNERKQNKINSRDESIRQGLNPLPIEDMMSYVSDADLANWQFDESIKKSKNFLKTLGVDMKNVSFCTSPNFHFNQLNGHYSDQGGVGFEFVEISTRRNLTAANLKELCDTHDWCIFYMTDESKLMTNEMGVIEKLRCAFLNNPVGWNTKGDFEELLADTKERFISLPLSLAVAHDDIIQDLIDDQCKTQGWIRANRHFSLIAEAFSEPKIQFNIK